MEIKNLQEISITLLTQTFNESFSDYLFPFHLSEADLRTKIKTENIMLNHSVGAFVGQKLVGFILIGLDDSTHKTVAYNAGTGVLPNFRGQHLTEKMYAFLIPHLAQQQITSHQLEVLTENQRAIPVYQKIGFEVRRQLGCFKGQISETASSYEIKSIDFPEHPERFWNHEPAYQNAMHSIRRDLKSHTVLGAFANETLVGYIAFVRNTGRIKQFGVLPAFRHSGIGHGLFYKAQQMMENQTVSIINVDANDSGTADFLQKIGMELTVRQYEMTKEI
ncbi:GNAT family N-acetyltransferase [Flavobacterium sp.]|uniref:GNAT family N-acetyltransferase n=1 Tax=Flavobacterium sp. TaxID=239 RepID=UPI0039E6760C